MNEDKTIRDRHTQYGHTGTGTGTTATNDLFKVLVAVMDTKWGAVSSSTFQKVEPK